MNVPEMTINISEISQLIIKMRLLEDGRGSIEERQSFYETQRSLNTIRWALLGRGLESEIINDWCERDYKCRRDRPATTSNALAFQFSGSDELDLRPHSC